VKSRSSKSPRPPLDHPALERLALFYVGRYATTKARVRSYLLRKVKERGWEGGATPPVDDLVERLAARGYVDDSAFASAKAASLQRRGFGERRVAQALRAAGIAARDVDSATEEIKAAALATALRFAERKRIGPYSSSPGDHRTRQKAFAAMMRAGHAPDVVRIVLDTSPGELPDLDGM
jgi:regulatory protein